MHTLKLNDVIQGFEKLPPEEKEYAFEIFNRHLYEEGRKKIVKRLKETRLNQKKGDYKEGSIKDLYQDLEND